MKDKIAIIGTGFLSEKKHDLLEFPNMLGNKKICLEDCDFDKRSPGNIIKKYTGISDYIKYGYISATKSLESSKNIDRNKCGVYCGTSYGGNAETYSKQCKAYYDKGISWMLPSMVMNKVPKTLADIVSIEEKLTGGSFTVHAGLCSSGMALLKAYDDIMYGRIESAVVIGAEYTDPYLLEQYSIMNYRNDNLYSCGSSLLLSTHANIKANRIKGYLLSCESSGIYFDPNHPDYIAFKKSVESTVQHTLDINGMIMEDIDSIIYCKTYINKIDSCFENVLDSLKKNGSLCITDIYGNTLGVNPLLSVLASLSIMQNKKQDRIQRIMTVAFGISGQVWVAILENIASR